MRRVTNIPVKDVIPPTTAVLKGQSIPQGTTPDERVIRLAEEAVSIYENLADPVGVMMEISNTAFEAVYHGEGKNEDETPLDGICRTSDSLALFAATVGEKVSTEISRLFDENEFALGSMLDSAASEGAEMAAGAVELNYSNYLKGRGRHSSSAAVLRFSPGYCGWHVSGQKKLFEFLRPGDVGIELGESCLMRPLKTVSGCIVAGPKEIFQFDDVFPFCRECDTHSCRDRIRALCKQ